MEHRIIPLQKVMEITSLGKSTIYARMSEGLFPKAVRVGKQKVGWIETEVHGWVASRVAQSRAT